MILRYQFLSNDYAGTTLREKKLWSREILIQKAPLPFVHSHSVSYGWFKRRLVDFLSIEYWSSVQYSIFVILKATSTDRQTTRLHIFKTFCIYLASDNTLIILVFPTKWPLKPEPTNSALGLPVFAQAFLDSIYNVSKWDVYSIKWHFSKCGVDEVKSAYFIEPSLNLAPGGGGRYCHIWAI